MVMIRSYYNPDNPRDVSDFIIVVCRTYKDPNEGPSRARRVLENMANQGSEGMQLLQKCYIDFCRQIPAIQDKDKLSMIQALARNISALSRVSIEWTY